MEFMKTSVEGLELSRVGIGCWVMGGGDWGGIVDAPAIEAIRAGLDMGITVIDTAPVYGSGHSEELVGKALADGYRKKAILATKCGLSWTKDGAVYRDCRPATMRKELDDSLCRLRTDYIDVYQIHWPDIKVPFAESAAVMLEFMKAGKIRAIGVSNFSDAQMDDWLKTAPIHTMQPSYNILEDKLFPNPIPYAQKHSIAIFGYSALARGMLSGAYSVGMKFKDGDMRQKNDPKYQGENFKKHLAAVEELKEYAKKFDKTVAQLAVRWVLDQGVTCALWGIRKKEQLEPIPGVMGWKLTPAQQEEVVKIVAKHVPVQVGKEFLTPSYRD
jgi:aryl-alcohol dehydrogenase-like predicted oxidoreductase